MAETTLQSNEFRCELCGEVFERALETPEQREARMLEEVRQNFGDEHREDDGIVCDDCYNKAVERFGKQQ